MEARDAGLSDVYIAEFGCVSALGSDFDALWLNLCAGQCGFTEIQRFSTANYVNSIAGCIDVLNDIEKGKRFDALVDLAVGQMKNIPRDCMLITATTKNNIELLEIAERSGKKSEKSQSLGEIISARAGVFDKGYNINAACASSSMAILLAARAIRYKKADCVLIFSADIVSEFVHSGFSALKALSSTTARPFDVGRDGLILGEAAGYILLMSESRMVDEHRNLLGKIRGWGSSSDATHITAPAQNGCGLKRAIDIALAGASLSHSDVAAICAHGTGTVYNDAMEITAFNDIFNQNIPPMFSLKGAMGHTLGPCGLIETIISLKCLNDGRVPGTVGLRNAESNSEYCLSNTPETIAGDYLLTTNSGFGGINAALLVERC